jgi:hypothetical protein
VGAVKSGRVLWVQRCKHQYISDATTVYIVYVEKHRIGCLLGIFKNFVDLKELSHEMIWLSMTCSRSK